MNVKPTCFLLVVLGLCLCLGGCSKSRPVILISLDTLRPDHLGCYGYPRPTSPCLDAFAAREAVLFEAAYAQAPYTLPSHMSIFTGLYPDTHRVLTPVTQAEGDAPRATRLADPAVTLAEILKSMGYATSAFTDGGLVSGFYGFDQGFDEYRDQRSPEGEPNGFRRFGPDLHQWVRDQAGEDFFLFIHTFDTHGPYDAPSPFAERFQGEPPGRELPRMALSLPFFLKYHEYQNLSQYNDLQDVVDAYDGCIAYVDHELNRFFELLRELDLWDDALIVVTSDHGEAFLENQLTIGHALFLTNEEVRIPLLIKFPESRFGGERVEQVVESVDILPTLLAGLEKPLPDGLVVQGQNLVQGLAAGEWQKDHAYGISPGTGGNRYLFRKGVKYLEGIRDEDFSKLVQVLKPVDPLSYVGKARVFDLNGEDIYYDLQGDPLGLKELFLRGDRLYDMGDSFSEWKAAELKDPAVFEAYRDATRKLAEKAWADGRIFVAQAAAGDALSEDQEKALASLGYGGFFDPAGSDLGGAASRPVPFPAPPFVDRSLLHEGDLLMSRFYQEVVLAKKPARQGHLALLEEARHRYARFLEQYPDKSSWVDWREKTMESIVKETEEKGLIPDKRETPLLWR